MTGLLLALGKAMQTHSSFWSRKGRNLLEMLMEGAEEKMECSGRAHGVGRRLSSWLLLWVPVRVKSWDSHRPFIPFSLVVLALAALLSGRSDWVSYLC